MKTRLALIGIGALLLVAGSAFGQGSAVIIKQRAKDVRDQNNVRQEAIGAAANAPATAQPAAPVTPPKPLTPQEQALAKVQSDLAAMKPDAQPSIAQKLQLGRDLLAIAQGPGKPSSASVNKLARDMADVLGDKLMAAVTVKRLTGDLYTVLNPTTGGKAQLDAAVEDVQAIFQANNVDRKDAVGIANDAKAIAAEASKAAAAITTP